MSANEKLLQDHEADGIQELDNDLPLWWFVGFVITVVFAVCYMVNYHLAWGPSSKDEYRSEVAAFTHEPEGAEAQAQGPIEPLTDFASLDAGRIIFTGATNNCFTCHRSDLGGQVGPNLTDDYWIHGCDLRTIMKNITTGFRDKGMLPYGTGARLTDQQVLQVASFILSKKGSNPPNPKPIDPERDVQCGGDQAQADAAKEKEEKAGKDDHERREKHDGKKDERKK
ncbi:MAG TPA: cbb3-type cytochrome c oxidase N-terminal domain-containing protein [Blastocatellia bacterium]|nr:cbb3-type cytochrome c oxidase N-terminal domain-containing protein [Blastocatellia bacterium]